MTSRSPKNITGLRYRLSPHHGQERVLVQACGANRWLWNWALRYREDVWLAAKSAGATGRSRRRRERGKATGVATWPLDRA